MLLLSLLHAPCSDSGCPAPPHDDVHRHCCCPPLPPRCVRAWDCTRPTYQPGPPRVYVHTYVHVCVPVPSLCVHNHGSALVCAAPTHLISSPRPPPRRSSWVVALPLWPWSLQHPHRQVHRTHRHKHSNSTNPSPSQRHTHQQRKLPSHRHHSHSSPHMIASHHSLRSAHPCRRHVMHCMNI